LVDHLAVLDVLGVQRLVAVPIADAFAARLIGSFEELHEAPGARGSSCARTVMSSSSTCVSMHSMSQKHTHWHLTTAPTSRMNHEAYFMSLLLSQIGFMYWLTKHTENEERQFSHSLDSDQEKK